MHLISINVVNSLVFSVFPSLCLCIHSNPFHTTRPYTILVCTLLIHELLFLVFIDVPHSFRCMPPNSHMMIAHSQILFAFTDLNRFNIVFAPSPGDHWACTNPHTARAVIYHTIFLCNTSICTFHILITMTISGTAFYHFASDNGFSLPDECWRADCVS